MKRLTIDRVAGRGRIVAACIAGAIAVVAYVALAIASWNRLPDVVSFSSAGRGAPASRPLAVYVDVLSIDPIRDAMDVRIDIAGGSGPHGTRYFGASDRTIDVSFGDGYSDRSVRLVRGAPLPSLAFTVDLTGSIETYPFDRYAGRTYIDAVEVLAGGRRRPLPVTAAVWPGVAGWTTRIAALDIAASGTSPEEDRLHLALGLDVRRPRVSMVYSLTIYTVMLLITISAASIAWIVYFRVRKFEFGHVNLFAAMLVALPLLRTGIPGAPPLGVRADLLVLLWAEVIVAAALVLAVVVWLRDGDRPDRPDSP